MDLSIFTDGGSRGNPGQAAIGVVVRETASGKFVAGEPTSLYELSKTIGLATNNEAEYSAILAALQWLEGAGEAVAGEKIASVNCYLDSKLVVEQLNKKWKIKEPRLREYAQQCWQVLQALPYSVRFSHIPREKNSLADALVNQALDAATDL